MTILPVVSRPPYLGNYQALEQVAENQLMGLADGCISLPISACSFFLFLSLWYFDYDMSVYQGEGQINQKNVL